MTPVAAWTRARAPRSVLLAFVLVASLVAGCDLAIAKPPTTTPPAATSNTSTAPSSVPDASGTVPGSGSGSQAPTSRSALAIARLQDRLRVFPGDGAAYRDLGAALLQRVRETGDPGLYVQADTALAMARRLLPDDPNVVIEVGTLELARHRFAEALVTGREAIAADPYSAPAEGVVVDALVELGRYDEAADAAQRMVDLRPDLASLARVSYLRELHGDVPGAIRAMDQAAVAASLVPENQAYVTVLLANLETYAGDRSTARAGYQGALNLVPDYAPALAGLGRLAVAAGDLPAAIGRFQQAIAVIPLPEYVIALGDAQAVNGDVASARRTYDLAQAEIQLYQANGVVVDLELALFEADHGDPVAAVRDARAAYGARPTIRAADALAWALYGSGDLAGARRYSSEALRLGTRDPMLRYHAGAIAAAAGDRVAARRELAGALALDSGFSAVGAAEARRLLASLGG